MRSRGLPDGPADAPHPPIVLCSYSRFGRCSLNEARHGVDNFLHVTVVEACGVEGVVFDDLVGVTDLGDAIT
jgi:hypothetical protein